MLTVFAFHKGLTAYPMRLPLHLLALTDEVLRQGISPLAAILRIELRITSTPILYHISYIIPIPLAKKIEAYASIS